MTRLQRAFTIAFGCLALMGFGLRMVALFDPAPIRTPIPRQSRIAPAPGSSFTLS